MSLSDRVDPSWPPLNTCNRVVLAGALLALSVACTGSPPDEGPADLVVRGGAIHTANARRPVAEALAVREGRFVFVGDSVDAERWIGATTEVVELEGSAAIPGLIDGHVHLEFGLSLVRGVDLTGIPDREE